VRGLLLVSRPGCCQLFRQLPVKGQGRRRREKGGALQERGRCMRGADKDRQLAACMQDSSCGKQPLTARAACC
jgi:hypothetical protein